MDGWRMYHGDKVPGFPAHPHRGFETVTIVRRGIVDHADSMGAAGRYASGDTQWLTAGKGVQHSEMFPLLRPDQDNPLELIQIWLNLPRANKMVEPYFTMFWREATPKVRLADAHGRSIVIDVIAGPLADAAPLPPPPHSWAADAENHVAIWTIRMDAQASWCLPAAASGLNRILYFYQGNTMRMDGMAIKPLHGVELHSDKNVLLENDDQDAFLLLLEGRPINEPVAHHGPFVMNTRDELQRAFMDYRQTEFGGWPWPAHDQVHPRDKGRFAKHADGQVEVRT
jgi:redox-sensitive bicupin YhaK (pirin superfamily)